MKEPPPSFLPLHTDQQQHQDGKDPLSHLPLFHPIPENNGKDN